MIQHNFTVRIANREDVKAIKIITSNAFQQYVKLAGIDHVEALDETEDDILWDIEHKIVLIAIINNVPVGSIRLEVKDDHTAYLSRFGVSMGYQNNGIGKMLINVTDKIMMEHGVKKLFLHTASKPFSLIRFYYSRGFFIDSTTKDKGYIRALLIKEYE